MDEKITFESVFHKYLEDMENVLEGSSLSTLQNSITIPMHFLKNKEIRFITQNTLEEMKNTLSKQSYEKHTIINYFKILSPIFSYAVKKKLMTTNPCQAFKLTHKALSPKKAYSKREIALLLEQSKSYDTRVYISLLLMLYGGLRRGEICGLQWEDIDFIENTVNIQKAVAQAKGGCYIKPPKNDGTRIIHLAQSVIDTLKEYRSSGYILKSSRNNFISPNYLTNLFCEFRKKAELKGRLYDVRHTHATYLVANGFDIVAISKRLGHTNVAMTLNVYAHALLESDKKLAEQFWQVINE